MRFLPVCFFAAAASAALPALAEDPACGYLFFLRTQKLSPLALEENAIGRLPENAIVLNSARVSRRHAMIQKKGDAVVLVDVGSSNGTLRNGERLQAQEAVPLVPGDRIEFADEVALYHRSLPELWRD